MSLNMALTCRGPTRCPPENSKTKKFGRRAQNDRAVPRTPPAKRGLIGHNEGVGGEGGGEEFGQTKTETTIPSIYEYGLILVGL